MDEEENWETVIDFTKIKKAVFQKTLLPQLPMDKYKKLSQSWQNSIGNFDALMVKLMARDFGFEYGKDERVSGCLSREARQARVILGSTNRGYLSWKSAYGQRDIQEFLKKYNNKTVTLNGGGFE